MEGLLAKVVDAYDEYSISLPDKRWITTGTPPADCEQLVIAVENVKPAKGKGLANPIIDVYAATAVVAFTVTVFRCATAECNEQTEQEQALDRIRDGWMLNTVLLQKHLAKELFPKVQCTDVLWQGAVTQAPFGALGATVLSVSVQVDPR